MMTRGQKRRLREKARLKNLDRLYAQQNSLCHWCKSQTAIVANIPEEQVLSVKNGFVAWKDAGLAFTAKIATTDHLKPVSEGGGNDPDNLVMACGDCNKDRTATRNLTPVAIRQVCPECGGEKPIKRRRCKACYVKRAKAWLAGLGWVEVPGVNGESSFRNPASGEVHVLTMACKIAGNDKDVVS